MNEPNTPMLPVCIGEVLAGKYRLERILGQGAMGVVVAAHHLRLDEPIAIKFLLPGAASNPQAVARFAREARAAAKIKNQHVVHVTDVGSLDDGTSYMVMEYLNGMDLAEVLARSGPLPIGAAVDYVLQACDALAEAHSLGIVHRDLKPANLFLASRHNGASLVKVVDFGISKMNTITASDVQMTATTALMGSPMYMSPEQMTSTKNVDARTDIWAMGVTLYELLTGKPPFLGETIPELCISVMQSAPQPMRALRPDVPPVLEQIVLRCLAKPAGERFQVVTDLMHALLPFADASGSAGPMSGQVSSLVPRLEALQVSATGPSPALAEAPAATVAAWNRTDSGTQKSPPSKLVLLVAMLFAAAVLGIGSLAFVLLRRDVRAVQSTAAATASVAPAARPEAPQASASASAAPVAPTPAAASVAAPDPSPSAAKPTAAAKPTLKPTSAKSPAKPAAGPAADPFGDIH